jgi:hypothetical protein
LNRSPTFIIGPYFNFETKTADVFSPTIHFSNVEEKKDDMFDENAVPVLSEYKMLVF